MVRCICGEKSSRRGRQLNTVYDKFKELKQLTDRIGSVYGTEDFAVYLYALIKMTKPRSVLELGTGLGSTALWAGLALEENGGGVCHTIDNGEAWVDLKSPTLLNQYYRDNYSDYITDLIAAFQLQNQIVFHNEAITQLEYDTQYDIVFCDYAHGPFNCVKLLVDCIPRMQDNAYIFIDSASTLYSSFHTLECTIDLFNQGRVPLTVQELISEEQRQNFIHKIQNCRFDLTHLVENKQRNQNSTAQIKISPIDIVVQPRINIRF